MFLNGGTPTRWQYNGASATITITDAIAPNTLVVVDHVCFSFTQPATPVGASITIDGNIVTAKGPATASQIDGLVVTFPGGYPAWSASGSDSAPDTSVAVVGNAAGSSGPTMFVAYHHENPGHRRSLNQ